MLISLIFVHERIIHYFLYHNVAFIFYHLYHLLFHFKVFFSHNPLFSWVSEMRLLSLSFRKVSSLFSSVSGVFYVIFSSMLWSNGNFSVGKKMECVLEREEMSILDLPELVIECILEKLPAEGLYTMASVCSSLREWCFSDRLWEKHMNRKWGRIIGPAAYREWQFYVAARNTCRKEEERKRKEFLGYLTSLLPFLRVWSNVDDSRKERKLLLVDSIMSWCLALESGNFCFPAQVYNRENGHVGFMLSCYDAVLIYDSCTDTFQARYPPHGTRGVAIETEVSWERVREQPAETYPYDVHISDCLNELRPGDHIEIQWRRNQDFPYGWWYGVVGHLELCDGNENYCSCHNSDIVALEFNQYSIRSRWRRTVINRKDHGEEGNETDGFYGGVRKLHSHEEISTWKRLWTTEVLE